MEGQWCLSFWTRVNQVWVTFWNADQCFFLPVHHTSSQPFPPVPLPPPYRWTNIFWSRLISHSFWSKVAFPMEVGGKGGGVGMLQSNYVVCCCMYKVESQMEKVCLYCVVWFIHVYGNESTLYLTDRTELQCVCYCFWVNRTPWTQTVISRFLF